MDTDGHGPREAAILLALVLAGSGTMHFVTPTYFDRLIPAWVPFRARVRAASGALDLATAALLLIPATRRAGGGVAALLISAYLPAHLEPLRAPSTRRPGAFDSVPGVAARLAVNLAYIAAGGYVAVGGRNRGHRSPGPALGCSTISNPATTIRRWCGPGRRTRLSAWC